MNKKILAVMVSSLLLSACGGGEGYYDKNGNTDGSTQKPDSGNGPNRPDLGNGQTPPDLGNGQIPPDLGNGQIPPDLGNGQIPPDLGNGQIPPDLGNGQTPPDLGNGQIPPVTIVPIPKPGIVPPSVIVPAPEQRELLQNLRFAGGAAELNKAQFGLENWIPRAIAARNGLLYIANDSGTANILRYDLNTKNVLAPIQPENIKGIGQSWNRLTDISIYKDRLYTSSLSSNRVDIFDIATGEAQLVMSLGTANWQGDQNLVTVHPISVAANDNYVFVADTHNRINVWKQSDVVPSNTLKAKKHARLSLPNCSDINCNVRLEAVGDLLYASFNNGEVYIYDVATIQQGATENDIFPIVPLKQTNPGINVFNTADDGLFYGSRNSGHVESFKPQELRGAENFLPKAQDSFKDYRLEGSSTNANLNKATDMVVNQQKVLQLSNGKVTILPIRTVQQYQSNQIGYVSQLQQAAALSQTYMLQDGEDWDTLTNPNLRYFKVNNILSAAVDKNNIQLAIYSKHVHNYKDLLYFIKRLQDSQSIWYAC